MTVVTTGRASQAADKRLGSAGDQVYVTSGAGVIDTWLNPPDRKNSDQNPVGSGEIATEAPNPLRSSLLRPIVAPLPRKRL